MANVCGGPTGVHVPPACFAVCVKDAPLHIATQPMHLPLGMANLQGGGNYFSPTYGPFNKPLRLNDTSKGISGDMCMQAMSYTETQVYIQSYSKLIRLYVEGSTVPIDPSA